MTQELLDDLIALNKKHNDAGVADLISDIQFELDVEQEGIALTASEYRTVWNKEDAGIV